MRIELNDVTKSIGGQMILNHITLSMTSGKVYGFQGIKIQLWISENIWQITD